MRAGLLFFLTLIIAYPFTHTTPSAQTQSPAPKPNDTVYLLKPAHVFDGESAQLHNGWVVLVRGEKVEAVGPGSELKTPTDAKVIDLPGVTLMPGLIEAHSHILFSIVSRNAERKKAAFKLALDAGVTIASGSDVGVFAHVRLERWRNEWGNRGAEAETNLQGTVERELVLALTRAKSWKLSPERVKELQQSCVTKICRQNFHVQ